ncbi:GatB/YqeY domain-containing protein [Rhodobacter sp. NTK016B]|uniref:GatB/YqeY domain-containing protein n=1 Tax=Rhodobacter sp. NTK016B TaxID=2759676 RepID=UPI001A8F5616|nr:GatB/YqeY domain-containing protein [Rhodobacter sp. NTK016B]MBN8292904.1 GatB/YqeY domain-containing protein [Rhodobacter sp. NTK016B]
MTLRARISEDLKQAMKNKDQLRLSTLRLINAAIKDRDIALRGDGEDREMSDDEITAVLSRMVKQRQESARAYEEGGRLELVEREEAEIKVIETYLPRQLSADEVSAAIEEVITELEAGSIRDMGPVMNALKSRYTGQMDFGAVGPQVKARLSGAVS